MQLWFLDSQFDWQLSDDSFWAEAIVFDEWKRYQVQVNESRIKHLTAREELDLYHKDYKAISKQTHWQFVEQLQIFWLSIFNLILPIFTMILDISLGLLCGIFSPNLKK